MMVLITYDVSTTNDTGCTRLRRVAKYCQNYGQRVQNSVFECVVEPAQYVKIKDDLKNLIDEEKDSLRFYMLGKKWQNRVEHIGAKESVDIEKGTLML